MAPAGRWANMRRSPGGSAPCSASSRCSSTPTRSKSTLSSCCCCLRPLYPLFCRRKSSKCSCWTGSVWLWSANFSSQPQQPLLSWALVLLLPFRFLPFFLLLLVVVVSLFGGFWQLWATWPFRLPSSHSWRPPWLISLPVWVMVSRAICRRSPCSSRTRPRQNCYRWPCVAWTWTSTRFSSQATRRSPQLPLSRSRLSSTSTSTSTRSLFTEQ